LNPVTIVEMLQAGPRGPSRTVAERRLAHDRRRCRARRTERVPRVGRPVC